MKTFLIFILCISINSIVYSQLSESNDIVTPFKGDIAAVKKGNKWGFINKEGDLVVSYSSNFVLTETKELSNPFPVFYDDRCLIKKQIDGVYNYGYINTEGKEIISPTFLNASNFKDGYAIVVQLLKDSIGFNKVLQKNVFSYKIEEYVIDKSGATIKYLENPLNYDTSKMKSATPPKIRSKFIAPHLVAVLKKNKKWDIYKF